MAVPRDGVYVWVSWLTKLLAGEESCYWKLWFRAHHKYDKRPSDFDLAKWTAEHTALRDRHTAELRAEGYEVFIEDQNGFRAQGHNGALLAGKADIVALRDGDACVIDCKTGSDKHSDKLQVLLYMIMLPHGNTRYRGRTFRGEVLYKDHFSAIPLGSVDGAFKKQIGEAMNIAAGTAQPIKAPSFAECRYRDISATDCPDRVHEEPEAFTTDLF